MNLSEEAVRNDLESQGYDVIHTGVPDFLLLKGGNIKFVEVKGGYNPLSSNQERAIDLLRKHGLEVHVKRLYTPMRALKLDRSSARAMLTHLLSGRPCRLSSSP